MPRRRRHRLPLILHGRLQHGRPSRNIPSPEKPRPYRPLGLVRRLTFRAAFAGFRPSGPVLLSRPLAPAHPYRLWAPVHQFRPSGRVRRLRPSGPAHRYHPLGPVHLSRPSALCACLASRTLRPHDAAKVNSAAIRQREDEPPPSVTATALTPLEIRPPMVTVIAFGISTRISAPHSAAARLSRASVVLSPCVYKMS